MIAVAEEGERVSNIAAAIGDPARARILYCLLDGHARTSTELAVVANVSPSTTSAHLNRLRSANLIRLNAQGRHRYYSLRGPEVAAVLEGLCVLSGSQKRYSPTTPVGLRAARTCYDHVAGRLGVAIHDRFHALRWLAIEDSDYHLTSAGTARLEELGIDLNAARKSRRRLAYPCIDWSERRPHLGGAMGAALLTFLLQTKWVTRDLNSRTLSVTRAGVRELSAQLGLNIF